MKPNAPIHYRPMDPEYLRELIAKSGLSQAAAAVRIGVSPRTMRQYLARTGRLDVAPYAIQYALERLASK